jgi:hypothetical protein
MYPIVLAYPARIDHMAQIVLRVHENKICVRNSVVSVTRAGLPRRGHAGKPLNGLKHIFGSRKSYKTSIEIVEPSAQNDWGVPCGIRGYEDKLHLISDTGWQFLQSQTDIRHVHGALIWTIRISEEE